MGNRFYTTLKVRGPNATAAEKAAIQALKDLSKDDKPRQSNVTTPEEKAAEEQRLRAISRGRWYDEDTIDAWEKGLQGFDKSTISPEEAAERRQKLREGKERPHFFNQNTSGHAAIETVVKLSRDFPTEVFHLYVDGSFSEGIQGPVDIWRGFFLDGRCDSIARGEKPDTPILDYLDADGNNAINTQTEADSNAALGAIAEVGFRSIAELEAVTVDDGPTEDMADIIVAEDNAAASDEEQQAIAAGEYDCRCGCCDLCDPDPTEEIVQFQKDEAKKDNATREGGL